MPAKKARLTAGDVAAELERRCPVSTAADYDNVGILLGDPSWPVKQAVVSVDLTARALQEARRKGATLIVLHHPCIFRGLKRLVPEGPGSLSSLMLEAVQEEIAVVACHTNFDACALDVMERISKGLGLTALGRLAEQGPVEGLRPGQGFGFYGDFSGKQTFAEVAQRVKRLFNLDGYWVTESPPARIQRVGFVAGKGASMVDSARRAGCDLFITGEAGYHVALEAARHGMALMELGHRESEFFFLQVMKDWLEDLGLGATALNVPTQRMIQRSVTK